MDGTPQDSCPTDVGVTETQHRSDSVPNGQLSASGISVLDRLIKTCPVWLQLCMGPKQAVEILSREPSGVFLVTRDVEMKCMVLWVHFADRQEAAGILRYNIREEKTMMYLEGSMLVFKDIFKLVAFCCVSRDILPSPLRLPHVISSAQSLKDLEVISNLGTGFWDSAIRLKSLSISQPGKLSSLSGVRDNLTNCRQQCSSEASDCACEIEVTVGNDRLWFVDPIFIEECSNIQTSVKLPHANCDAKPDLQLPKISHRRPPPPPPPSLHKPPLPSVPPSAPPPTYKPSRSHSPPVGSPTPSALASSPISKTNSLCPALGSPPTDSLNPTPPANLPSSDPLSLCPSPKSPEFEPFTLHSSDNSSPTGPPSLCSPHNSSPASPIALNSPPNSPSTEPLVVCSPASTSPTESSPSSNYLATPQSSAPLQQKQTDLPLPSSTSEIGNKEKDFPEPSTVISVEVDLVGQPLKNMRINSAEEKKDSVVNDLRPQGSVNQTPARIAPAVPRRRQSGKLSETKTNILAMKKDLQGKPNQTSPDLKIIRTKREPKLLKQTDTCVNDKTRLITKVTSPEQHSTKAEHGQQPPPVPPPRKNKLASRSSTIHSSPVKLDPKSNSETPILDNQNHSSGIKNAAPKGSRQKRLSSQEQKGSDNSLYSPSNDPNAQLSTPEPDSYSTSSAEEDAERPVKSSLKKSQSFMLDRPKNRHSFVPITNVFLAFMSADRKLQKRITELAHDKDSYFGNLVQDYKSYSLEMMAKQSSSTEMLQEIRLMMTQLKSYLVQSTELKSMVGYTVYTDDKIDTIVEAALCKCVLKPLKAPVECYLREIHNKDGSLRLLTENQMVIQDTTTTDLGVTTSVPDSSVMEKIIQKFVTMHKTYSPEKKVTYLLKSCKLIYDSMATGNPGKPHGADDFLPVLMYVLARCDLVSLLLDVEYMMELMDPALQLGEGSYYLTTTYGALEHIKNYDKITVTRQLSMEVQDSIHRWERRRTLNKARVSRSSIQDFITISFEELDSTTRTLATKSDTSVAQVLQQCAEKFEVSEPEKYGLFVLVNERCLRLSEDAFPQQVKSCLLKNEQKLDFNFLYKTTSLQDTTMKELDFL